jgi:hypothetical protein
MAALQRLGIAARIAWHGNHDRDALVLVEPTPENVARLEDGWRTPPPHCRCERGL